jgi:hypothetical protein
MEEECPLPPPGACSPELRDFLAQCMRKDPWQRPTAEQLLRHPFVLQQGCVGARLWAGCVHTAACLCSVYQPVVSRPNGGRNWGKKSIHTGAHP